MDEHSFFADIVWTGNTGQGTSKYDAYERRHDIKSLGKPVIPGSSDIAFRGDHERYNPEDLLVASVAACHMLWFLGLCARAGIVVTGYQDKAEGKMKVERHGGGRFTRLVLRPRVTFAPGTDLAAAHAIHEQANANCFIANSLNFKVEHEAAHEHERSGV